MNNTDISNYFPNDEFLEIEYIKNKLRDEHNLVDTTKGRFSRFAKITKVGNNCPSVAVVGRGVLVSRDHIRKIPNHKDLYMIHYQDVLQWEDMAD